MGYLFLAFVMLVSISVGATFWGIDAQKKDALIINLAGRQRMLIQLMTRLAIERRYGDNYDGVDDLNTAITTFEQTLSALKYGGVTPYLEESIVELPPTQNEQIQAQLDQVQNSWEAFQTAIDQIVELPPNDVELVAALQTIEALSPVLVEQADSAVRLYEAESTQKVFRLRNLQIGFFVSALLFLGIGIQVIQKSILKPLKQLGTRAAKIGSGDLKTPGGFINPAEIALLDGTLDTMQDQLRDSRLELLTWAETLEERVDQRTRVLDALYEISRDISSRLDVQFVLESVTEKARQLLIGEIATLCLLNEQDESLVHFLSNRYGRKVPRHSGVIYRKGHEDDIS
ncbi:MAG: type IV pili methyl-accepting chemotaxis transducer N-terminal domain-containing protein [Anaerolineales bacterium]|nr:type IV pili methyl-accepting chemotaxis transducer N-terminal domain-containing protein [Anaerolineales bacterium]